MIYNIAQSMGDTLIRDQSTPGGYSLEKHTTNATTINKIKQGNWNVVILQEGAGVFMNNPHSYNLAFARNLNQLIKNYNPGCSTLVFVTWGRKYGCCPALPCNENAYSMMPECTYRGQDSVINKFSMMIADSLQAPISPVGAIWRYLIKNNPGIELYNADLNHPSPAGTYAAACCFYTVLFKKDPETIPYDAGVKEAGIIKKAVKLIVYDSLAKWRISAPDQQLSIPKDIFSNQSKEYTIYPNRVNDLLILRNLTDRSVISICTIEGKLFKTVIARWPYLEVPVNGLPPGINLIKIEEGKIRRVMKFVKY
jgi:hypothetical protein